MVQHFFINGQQFTSAELNAAKKAGKVKTKKEAQAIAAKIDTKADVVKKIEAKIVENGLVVTEAVIKFLGNSRTTLKDLNDYLKNDSNFEVELELTKE